jgi:hypothetical protein
MASPSLSADADAAQGNPQSCTAGRMIVLRSEPDAPIQ